MSEYSEFIANAMKYVDREIVKFDSDSIDRNRLHNNINVAIVANVKKLVALCPEDGYKAVDDILKTQLNAEILNRR